MSKAVVENVELSTSTPSEAVATGSHSLESNYGLAVDPFADKAISADDELSRFFMGGDRRSVLDEVSHLCQFSNNLVAVLGEAGVGKTALVQQLLIELNDTAQCCLIQSSVMAGVDDVLKQLSAYLGVYTEPEMNSDHLLQSIAQYQPSGIQQRVVVVVDDAHHLGDQVLSSLIQLLQQQSSYYIHVLLVGDSSLLLRLDQLDKGDILTYDIPLCPFKEDELGEYLNFKLAVVGYEGTELFDQDTIYTIWNDTRGIPASANRSARQLLINHSLTEEDSRSLGLPIWHMAFVVVLLASLLMAVFYSGEGDVGDQAPPVVSSELAIPERLPEEVINNTLEPAAADVSVVDPAEIKSSTINSASSSDVSPVAAVNDQESTSKITDTSSDKNRQVAAVKVSESVGNVVGSPSPASAPSSQSEPKNTATPSSPAQTPTAVSSTNASQPPTLRSSTGKKRALTQDEEAVLFWPVESYTLQIMAAGQRSGIASFVQAQSNRSSLRIIEVERKGAPWYVVLTGVYSTREEARSAIATLPPSQSSAKPWPRKISEIQQEVTSFRRQ